MREKNIKRQKIWQRDNDEFTYEEKYEIGEKSDHKCCHCGKVCFPGYGATIDHFVPLAQGGKSVKENLIMLCTDCNQEKRDKIYEPEMYLKYLKDEPKKQLMDYFNSYVHSFDFFSHRCVLACDKYSFEFELPPTGNFKRNRQIQPALWKVDLNRIDFENYDEVRDFYIRYLKKKGDFVSEEACDENLLFWSSFGCMYGVWQNHELNMLLCLTETTHFALRPKEESDRTNQFSVTMAIMPMYANDKALSIVNMALIKVPRLIREEQGLPYVLLNAWTVPNEDVLNKIAYYRGYPANSVQHNACITGDGILGVKSGIYTDEGKKDFVEFFQAVDKQKDLYEKFFEEYPKQTWMRGFVETNRYSLQDEKEEEEER